MDQIDARSLPGDREEARSREQILQSRAERSPGAGDRCAQSNPSSGVGPCYASHHEFG
jgi:hypothetical protein